MAKIPTWGSKTKNMNKELRKMKREEAKRRKQIKREQKKVKAEQKKAQKWATKADKNWGGKPKKDEAQFTRKRGDRAKWIGKLFKRESYVTLRNYYGRMDQVNENIKRLVGELRGAKDGKTVQSIVGRYLGQIEQAGGGAVSALMGLFKKAA